MEIKTAGPQDFERILTFEKACHKKAGLSEAQLMMKSWNEPWRDESLNFYLKGGWCFLSQNPQGEVVGYILCQPLLFFSSMAQSLWVEYAQGREPSIQQELVDVAWRWARSKHLQKIYFNQDFISEEILMDKKDLGQPLAVLGLNTTKMG